MATSSKHSPTPERIASEDPDTAAARKELRQTAISEKPDLFAMAATSGGSKNLPVASDDALGAASDASGKAATPELDARDDVAREQMSPKKKRAHAELDESKDGTSGAGADGDVSPISAGGSASLNRTDRSEPEKKRPRDVSSETRVNTSTTSGSPNSTDASGSATGIKNEPTSNPGSDKAPEKNNSSTTTSAFKSSGISSFAAQASPFLQAGTGQTLSSFASSSSAKSPFAFSSSSATATKSIFNGGGKPSNGAVSPFGQMSSSAFGSSTFGGFKSSLGGSQLTSFGKGGEPLKSVKPARPFGAPASESDHEDEDGEDGNTSENDKDDAENRDAEEQKATETEDKKKTKLQRVTIDDGEAGEATLIQVRGRLYNLDKASNSWKERGAGNLKINVPRACVRTEDPETALPGTFDATALKDAESKVVRLVMRQDSTHRVILNTAIIPTMKFQEKSSLKATFLLFTAIEDGGAVSVQIKMNAANAKSFLNEVETVQLQLRSV